MGNAGRRPLAGGVGGVDEVCRIVAYGGGEEVGIAMRERQATNREEALWGGVARSPTRDWGVCGTGEARIVDVLRFPCFYLSGGVLWPSSLHYS